MKFITVRDLRGRSGQVWSTLAREREVILTSNGKPIAILSAVSEETLEESLRGHEARASRSRCGKTATAIGPGRYGQALPAEIAAEIHGGTESPPSVKVVVDTNVLIAGLLSPFGSPG